MRIASAILLLLVAAALGLVESLAVLDPVGTKMADDSDPFGDPSVPWAQHAAFVVAMLACVGGACLLLRRGKGR